jgi:hypothetical protein
MSPAEDKLYQLKRKYNVYTITKDYEDDIVFLLDEIDRRENQIKTLVEEVNKQTAILPNWAIKIADEYGIEYNGMRVK